MNPKTKPYRKGFLKVGDGHKLFYEACGNPNGFPIIYIHGGPGSGCSPQAKKFFNAKTQNVIFFDQRGAGRSKPFASLKANTTQKLSDDINKVLDHFGWKKAFFFGGSWGSTLSLHYAIQNPERVMGLLLRGIFLGSKRSIKHYIGGDVAKYFPEVWERFIQMVPKKYQKDPVDYYFKKMKSKNKSERKTYCYEWAYYELSIAFLNTTKRHIEKLLTMIPYESLSPLEALYMQKQCFMTDNYILKRAPKMESIPLTIVQGRYDVICPPQDAYELHQAWPKSKLNIVFDGHVSSGYGMFKKLKQELKVMQKRLS